MKVKVLGPGCSKCQSTTAMIERVAKDLGVPLELEKIEDREAIQSHGVTATPAVIIRGNSRAFERKSTITLTITRICG